jgi:signal transduction histidine kinase
VVSPTRLVAAASLTSILIAGIGLGTELLKFGLTGAAASAHLEKEIRQTVAERSADVERLAGRIAQEHQLIARAIEDRERVPELFDRLIALTGLSDQHDTLATIYAPTGRSAAFAPLAWSRGSGEDSPPASRLTGAPSLFVAPGLAGMRLVFVQPITSNGVQIASAVAETVLAHSDRATPSVQRLIQTSLGPATILEPYVTSRDDNEVTNGFAVDGATGAPLLIVTFEPEALAARRLTFRRHAVGLALLPILAALALLIPRETVARTGGRVWDKRPSWWARTWRPTALLSVVTIGLLASAQLYGAGPHVLLAIGAGALLGLIVILPGASWWQPRRRTPISTSIGRYAAEQLLAGLAIAIAVECAARLLARWISPASLDRWQFVLFPFDASAIVSLGTLLTLELALAWATASVVAFLAGRWTARSRLAPLALAVLMWALPTSVLLGWPTSAAHSKPVASAIAMGSVIAFALASGRLRHYYRHTTQSTRLVLGLLAVAMPLIAFYPLGAQTADLATRQVIERDYAPQTANHQQELLSVLDRAQHDIDRFLPLAEAVTNPPAQDSQAAFFVWNQTSLARARVTSDVELYRLDGRLVSRFAFNLAEFGSKGAEEWRASKCEWEVFGEPLPFGAEQRLTLHAMRGVCDSAGRILGGVIVHVASDNYEALPFVASSNPYNSLIKGGDQNDVTHVADLQVAVYGWSSRPNFTSGQVGWILPRAVFARMYNPGVPFWTTLDGGGRQYEVHFSQNRVGVYALGYPRPTAFDHTTRLAELLALAAVLFVIIQIAALASAPFARRHESTLGQLFHEMRTSFYRKLFLSFIAAAVVPVLIFAFAFGSYMTARFRADVESEAAATVTVARRVFEELAAADARSEATVATPTDDVMVWIHQVIGQDVNLFKGPELVSTSQRDLFDSKLVTTRTPADVYRSILLQRRPIAVVADRVGDFTYLVAAAPVAVAGRDAVLTVPLAPRQREIGTDELNRGVLVGSVLVVLLAAGVGASLASRIAKPVGRLTRATRQIAAGNLDVRVATDTADELRRLVDDFNSMAETLGAQRSALVRTNQLKAWNEMARQVAHEIKNPLTPIQLAAEHLQHVHEDRGRPLGTVMDECMRTILGQVRLLRRIASEFSNFSGEPRPHPEALAIDRLVNDVVDPYRHGIAERVTFELDMPEGLPRVWADRTLLARAITNLIENAIQAMPGGGTVKVAARSDAGALHLSLADDGVGMDEAALARAFEPFFSTKTGGSGLGLANAKRNIEIGGGTIGIDSVAGRGTTVTVSLPLAPPASRSASIETEAPDLQ